MAARYKDYDISYTNNRIGPGSSTPGYASVTLRRYDFLDYTLDPTPFAVRMRVEVIAATNVPKELFLWERAFIPQGGIMVKKDRVLCVVHVSDLSTYPVNDPDSGESSTIPPFYRMTYFDSPFDAVSDYESTWRFIMQGVYDVLKSLVDLELTNDAIGWHQV